MKKTQTITAVIPAHNEEDNIKRCLESVQWCDKIQVLWTGEDKTGDIAKKLKAEIIEMNKGKDSNFVSVQKNINWAIDNATTDWILRIDADEVVTDELREEIQKILQTNKQDTEVTTNFQLPAPTIVAYGLPRKQYFLGDFLKGGDWVYDRLVRLFKPEAARYEPIVEVHEQFKVNGEVGELKHALLHYSHPTLKDVIRKFNLYTSMESKHLEESFIEAFVKMIFMPPYVFLRWVIWHKGYKDGTRGVIAGFLRGWYDFLVYAKYIQYKYLK